jgi:putative drug exporter of the RND superfamily
VTVAVSLAAIAVFPLYFLRSIAIAGVSATLLAAAAALVLVPAMIALLGTRIDSLDVRTGLRRLLRRPPRVPATDRPGFWHRLAVVVMRRPVPIAGAVLAGLVVLGSPFLGVRLGLPDDRALAQTIESRQAGDLLRDGFDARETDALSVVATGIGPPRRQVAAIRAYATELSRVEGVSEVSSLAGRFAGGRQVAPASPEDRRFAAGTATWLRVVPGVEPLSAAGSALVRDLRGVQAPFPVQVTGAAAELVDTTRALADRMPVALGLIAVATYVLLFLFTGSVLLPAKALLLNVLSLSAAYGAMVWVFQDGHLSGLLGGFTATGAIVATVPVLMFCTVFGLSMDYEIFMLSRIKEEYRRTGDTVSAVAFGLDRTGRLITSAAALMAIVFVGLARSDISFMQMLGVGLTLAVLTDATVVRGVLVPAFMRLAGHANWWAPAPLRALHERVGLAEGGPPGPDRQPPSRRRTGRHRAPAGARSPRGRVPTATLPEETT